MNWIHQLPPLNLPDENSPSWPYLNKRSPDQTGFFAILTEPDAEAAIEDQVAKLGATFDRSSLIRWRQRMGEERVMALLQESLAVAVRTGAMALGDTHHDLAHSIAEQR